VTLGLPVFRDADLTGNTSDLRVLLVEPSGRQVEPVELVRIARPSADQRRYFPSIHRQRHTYRLAFPALAPDGEPTIPADAAYVELRFAAAAGTVNLRWELTEGPEPVVPAMAPSGAEEGAMNPSVETTAGAEVPAG